MVLKRISPSQVELGMYIQSFHGNWLRHPFWRAQFLVEDEERLETVRNSELDAVIIDTDRGADVPAEDPPAPAPTVPFHMRPVQRRMASVPPPRGAIIANGASLRSGPIPISREFGNARLVAGKARKTVSKVFLAARLGKAPRVIEVAPVVDDIHASIERNPFAFSGLMRCKSDSEPVYRHMLATSALMVSLARQMRLPPGESRLAGMAGLLLDIGVARLDVEIGEEAGGIARLDPRLWERHTLIGRDLLEAAGDMPDAVLHAVGRHHEHLDGSGRPLALVDLDLDLFSRMAAICDFYDLACCGALTGTVEDPSHVLAHMSERPNLYDAEIVARFIEAVGVYPIGSFVTLRSGRIAMVVDQDPEAPELPTVHAFYSAETGRHVGGHTIALAHCYGEDAIMGVARLENYALPPASTLRERISAQIQRMV
ncbi:HD-GYP domain-containing protein (c-di-GMP phosphodiesterase class II) [Novosphingobium sp. PhB165]|uniref:HD-GYP domain-containing protein n=1 Tax=Novosphingobium sp. PhB165 TaxID=2485105 RepID=UPI001047DCD5|nr:HD-GYP domain-containing protein [Novosphingobium sp. PhB165]TCM17971.1 HD-GYP domain-containing protein (c-di-GMP phosphodiesterase class II) [Novosphingobium sp. PhB165]